MWDESVVLSATVADHVVVARRSGERWWLAAMNGELPLELDIPLSFLGPGEWTARVFADGADPATPETVIERSLPLPAARTLRLSLQGGGGCSAVLCPTAPGALKPLETP